MIDGVGPKITAMLHEAGVTSLHQIAAMSETEMAELDERLELRGRSAREAWVEQAQELLAGERMPSEVDVNHQPDNAA
jgi:predicted flap endonuclease-1-like 5' DNA nuclease